MIYKKFGIVDTARRCGIPIDEQSLGQEEVLATCPFCGDNGRGKYHLGLKTDSDQYYCVLCKARGNSVSLYARQKNLSNKEAVKELESFGSQKGDSNIFPFPIQPEGQRPKKYREPKGIEERDAVYRDMLSFLPLSPEHRADLRRRGLSDEQIKINGYRSLPTSRMTRRDLAAVLSHFHDLSGVPGFYQPEKAPDTWSMSETGGLLVPVRDVEGRIEGFQIRLDDAVERKYRWFSTKAYNKGTRSHAWIHVVGDKTAETAYLTEGGLKGDVASYLAKERLFICVPGVNSLDKLPDVLKQLHIKKLVVCMDMDKVYKPNVQSALQEVAVIVKKLRICAEFPNWDPGIKGIDDYYLAWRAHGYRPKHHKPTPITGYLGKVWEQQYPNCDREFIALCDWEAAERPVADIKCLMPTRDDEIEEIERYRQALRDGALPFPPLVCINGDVAEGRHRYWAWRMEGHETVPVYQNKQWQEAA